MTMTLKTLPFVLLLTLGLTMPVLAQQTAEITGSVTGPDSEPLAYATIYVTELEQGTSTGSEGQFQLQGIEPGDYTLAISHIGYQTLERQISLQAGEQLELDLSLEEAVAGLSPMLVESQTMTGGSQGVKKVPGSATFIPRIELEKHSYTDINRVLQSVPGVNLKEEDGFGLRPNIGMRGSGNKRSSKINIMEDGILAAPAPYAAPAAYYFPTTGRMHGVEVVKGISQIEHGPLTTAGALNLLSTPIPDSRTGQLDLWGGSHVNRNLHAMYGDSHRNVSYMVETFQYGSNGFKEIDGGGDSGFHIQDYLGKVRLHTGQNAETPQSLMLKAGYHTETSNETYLGLTRSDFEENPHRRYASSRNDVMNTEHSQLSLHHSIQPSERLDINTTVYRNDFHRNWYKLGSVTDPQSGDNIGISSILAQPERYAEAYSILTGDKDSPEDALIYRTNNREYYSQGAQSELGLTFSTSGLQHRVNLGLRYHEDQIDRFQLENAYQIEDRQLTRTREGEPGSQSNRIQEASSTAAYVRYQLEYGNLTATPGLRYENITMQRLDYGTEDPDRTGENLEENRNTVDVFMPGIGLNFEVNAQLSAFAGIHKGFAPPSPQPETRAEESINYEAGLRYDRYPFNGQAAVFFNDYENLLGNDLAASGGGGTLDQFNGGAVETKGIELEAGYDLYNLLIGEQTTRASLPVSATYTYTNAVFQSSFDSDGPWGTVDSGDQLPYLPEHQGSLSAGIEYGRVRFDVQGIYKSPMRTGPGQGTFDANHHIPSYFTVDLSGHYDITDNIALFGNVKNLTDATYIVAAEPAGVRPGLPRTIQAGIKAGF